MGAITLAVMPSATPGDSRFALDSLCVALTKLLDTPVHGINSASYQDLANELEKDRVDYAWMSPTLMMLTNERIQLRPLLSAVRYGRTEYASALFIRDDKPWWDLEELYGKTVAWVDPTSASGYLIPRLHIASRGLDPATFFGKELFLRSHDEVAHAVRDGRADVGATFGQRPEPGGILERAGFLTAAKDTVFRVIEWTHPIPSDMIVGHGLLSKPEHRTFSNAILTLCERESGRRLLHRTFHTEQFMTTPRNTLKPLAEMVEAARAHGLFVQM
jgi:phosphate/phosphite/phosphonate ABC transporter binding protein